jgi:hypothetical protein
MPWTLIRHFLRAVSLVAACRSKVIHKEVLLTTRHFVFIYSSQSIAASPSLSAFALLRLLQHNDP